jgi:hypothetical protein
MEGSMGTIHTSGSSETREFIKTNGSAGSAGQGPTGPAGQGPTGGGRRKWAIVVAGVVVLVALLAWLAVVLIDDDEEDVSTGTTTTEQASTTEPTATTAEPGAQTTAVEPSSTTAIPPVDLSTAVWPTTGSSVRFDDPVDAAEGFATDFVGFEDPVVGEFQQGDTRSGEVAVRPVSNGPVTTVLVRQLGSDGSWWVLGSVTADIQLTAPAAGSAISSPVRLQGTSTAFEANVGVEIRQDGSTAPIGEGYVMGGSMGEMGPFDSELTFTAPTADSGAIVLTTDSMENGQIWGASVVRVQFAG